MATKGRSEVGRVPEGPVAVEELTYSEAGRELDAIIEEFEAGAIDVDSLVERLQRATSIVDELDRRLRRTRMQVEELVPRLESIGREEVGGASDPADTEDGEDGEEDEIGLITEIEIEMERAGSDAPGDDGPTGLF